ncbi:hypothetical protein CYY_008661 [Polysphondylium violaceum]|uniref:Short-chain dehydrogenase/reductase family protein n=1 Tax=Polysphondylium violaceum TaxID=133409 RepID=A0A8J4PLC7_9MYCE|nr:hypothetical protein CYY_008661 [Polysphondylium violaceum]
MISIFINSFVYYIPIVCFLLILFNKIALYIIVLGSKEQDIRKKYQCEWALVTGSCAGIGKEICDRLARQGVNIVMVSKSKDALQEYSKQLMSKYRIRTLTLSIDLKKSDSVQQLFDLTESIDIGVIFNNAGYLTMEGFDQTTSKDKIEMLECNSIAPMRIAEHYYRKWLDQGRRRGAIIFTSSSTAVCPTPFSVMYASSKSFLSTFAESLSIEARHQSIDILAIRPGLVKTHLFDNVPKHMILKLLSLVSQSPKDIVDVMFKSVGRYGIVVLDVGIFGILSGILRNIIGVNMMASLVSFTSFYLLKDFSIYYKHINNKKKQT